MLTGRDIEHKGTSLWCAGLPLVEERRLEREEQEHLRHVAWRLLWQGIGSFLGLAVLGILLMVLTSVLGGSWGGTLIIIAVIFASLLLFLPTTLFAHEGWTQRSLLLFRDLRHGYVTVFAGPLTEADLLQTEDAVDTAQRRLLALGFLTFNASRMQAIEVLPVSRRVWRVSSERVGPWVEARLKEVAVSNEATIPWLHAGRRVSPEGEVGRRRLSDRERSELFREARQHWVRPFVPALLLTSWCLLVVVLAVVSGVTVGRLTAASVPWGSLHLAWIAFAADAFFLRRWGQAQKMYQDARGGEVASSVGSPLGGGDSAVISETLPNSGRLWTQAGKPAPWRRIGR